MPYHVLSIRPEYRGRTVWRHLSRTTKLLKSRMLQIPKTLAVLKESLKDYLPLVLYLLMLKND